MNNFLLGLGVILAVIGVKLIYDARLIVKSYFSFGDENEATTGLKIVGFLVLLLGGFFIYFNF